MKPLKKAQKISERVERDHQDYLDRLAFCARNFLALKKIAMTRVIRGARLFQTEHDFTTFLIESHILYSRIPVETLDDLLRTFCTSRYRVILRRAEIASDFRAVYFPFTNYESR